jgi:hypothetical protein
MVRPPESGSVSCHPAVNAIILAVTTRGRGFQAPQHMTSEQ